MLQILPVAFVQVKADNTFQKLLNEIRQMINKSTKMYTKKVDNNIINAIKFRNL